MKNKLLAIGQVVVEKEIYPRFNVDWVTQSRYYYAMKSGEKFPPIVVAFLDGKYYLVDGMHRLNAYKSMKETHVQAEVLKNLKTKQDIYQEAVKRNSAHGRQFSTQEVTNIVITLEEWNLNKQQISELVHIPIDTLSKFVAKRVVRIVGTDNGVESQEALRSSLKHYAGTIQNEEFITEQENLHGSNSQLSLLNMCIDFLENGWFDMMNEEVVSKLEKLGRLLEGSFESVKSVKPKVKK